MNKILLSSNDTKHRLLRTILQGIIGVIVAYIDVIIGTLMIPNELRPMIVALVMAILSPIMSELGKSSSTVSEPEDSYRNEYMTEEELASERETMGGEEDV